MSPSTNRLHGHLTSKRPQGRLVCGIAAHGREALQILEWLELAMRISIPDEHDTVLRSGRRGTFEIRIAILRGRRRGRLGV